MTTYRRTMAAFPGLRTLAMLAVVLTMLFGMTTSVADARQGQTSVFIWTKENGQVVYDACYILVDFRDVACDDNGNGYVFFSQVPVGTYTVRQVADLGPNRYVPDFTIEVTGIGDPGAPYPGMEMFSTEIIASSGSSGAEAPAQETWTASVQVNLCDAPPGSGSATNCQAGAGVTVDISLASGEWMGSCTTGDPQPTPWDTYISTCGVEGLPFNADLVATQDPATIPPGYVPSEETLTLHVDDLVPGGGDQATFTFFNVPGDAGTSTSSSSGPAASTGTADPMSILPSSADVPGDLVETGRRARPLEEVAGNYTDPAETTQLFTEWGWQGNAVASFALPSGQEAQSGQVNGIYVSIHQFSDADAARAALDFSLTEQAAGTVLQEVPVSPLGEHTRALYGPMDYGNETTVLTQQGGFFVRVSAAMLDGDPTADAISVTEAILRKVPSTGESAASGSQIDYFVVGCSPNEACLNATVTVSTEDGEIIASGTCPDTVEITPWACVVRNVPRGIPVMITIDSIAPGYVAEQEALTWDTTKEPSPGPNQEMPVFSLVPAGEGASSGTAGTVITSETDNSGEATLLMTFRGCPEGFDPGTGDFFAECTIPSDAPDNAYIYWGVKLENDPGGMRITNLERQENGAYVFRAGPGRMALNISYLSPVVRDAYRVIGVDNDLVTDHLVYLSDGETREVFIFYYFT